MRPGYFDWPWRSIAVSVSVDPVSSYDFRCSDDPDRACAGFLAQHYPGHVVIYTDRAVDPASGRAGCGSYVVGDNFKYGLSLSSLLTRSCLRSSMPFLRRFIMLDELQCVGC